MDEVVNYLGQGVAMVMNSHFFLESSARDGGERLLIDVTASAARIAVV